MSPRTKQQNEEIRNKTKQQIIDAALELFGKEGFSKTSISAIATKAGISKGLIYHYFKSKVDILENIFHQMMNPTDDIFSLQSELAPADKMKLIIESSISSITNTPELMRLMISLALQPDAVKSVQGLIDNERVKQIAMITEILHQTGHDDADSEAYYLAAKLDGIMIGYLVLGKDFPIDEIKQKLLEEYVPS